MNMFGLEGSGFIVSISLCLLMVGAVVYYFNTRVASLEKALVRQNQVLADFIQNVRASHIEGVRAAQIQSAGDGATEQAVAAAKEFYGNTVPQDRVDVSDGDDDDEDETDDDAASSSELGSDDDEEEADDNGSSNIHVEQVDGGTAVFSSMIIDITGVHPMETTKSEPQVIELTDNDNQSVGNLDTVEVKEEPVSNETKLIKLSEVDDLDGVSSSLGSSLADEEEEDDGVTIDSKQENVIADFSKLKVAKLKELAQKRGIKNAAKMKKADLVAALEQKK